MLLKIVLAPLASPVCVCVCVCVRARGHVCRCVHVLCASCMHVCVYTNTCECVRCVCVYVPVCVCVCVFVYFVHICCVSGQRIWTKLSRSDLPPFINICTSSRSPSSVFMLCMYFCVDKLKIPLSTFSLSPLSLPLLCTQGTTVTSVGICIYTYVHMCSLTIEFVRLL